MQIVTFNAPIIISKLEAHQEIKPKVLEAIDKMGRYSYVSGGPKWGQKITHTDWHLGGNHERHYWGILEPHLKNINDKICKLFQYHYSTITNYWFQWYERGDFHSPHTHISTMFSNVYYLNLDPNSPRTTFIAGDQEFDIDVVEGSVITFPSMLSHKSKPNDSDTSKVVIAFNSDFFIKGPANE